MATAQYSLVEIPQKKDFFCKTMADSYMPGTRVVCIDYHPMTESPFMPQAYGLITHLATTRQTPFWMIRGYLANPQAPRTMGHIRGDDGEAVRIMGITLNEDNKLLAVVPGNKRTLEELAHITRELTQDYRTTLQAGAQFDALFQAPSGELYGQSIMDERIVNGPIHLATYNKGEQGHHWLPVNRDCDME